MVYQSDGSGPPMLPGMTFGAPAIDLTINVEGSVVAEDLAGTVQQGLDEIAARGGTDYVLGGGES